MLQEDLYVYTVVPVTPENTTMHLKTDHLGNSASVFILSVHLFLDTVSQADLFPLHNFSHSLYNRTVSKSLFYATTH